MTYTVKITCISRINNSLCMIVKLHDARAYGPTTWHTCIQAQTLERRITELKVLRGDFWECCQAICKVHLAHLASSKPNGQFSPSTCKVPLSNAVSGNDDIRLEVMSKEHQTQYLKVFAKVPGDDDSESNSRKTCEHSLDAFTDKPGSNLRSEYSSLGSTESSSHVEEGSNYLSFPRLELPQYLFDHQVYLHILRVLHLHVSASEQWNASRLETCNRNYLVRVTNLIHFLALHCLDVDQLKEDLCSVGLLNLEFVNPHVLASITTGIRLSENEKGHLIPQENEKVMDLDITP